MREYVKSIEYYPSICTEFDSPKRVGKISKIATIKNTSTIALLRKQLNHKPSNCPRETDIHLFITNARDIPNNNESFDKNCVSIRVDKNIIDTATKLTGRVFSVSQENQRVKNY